MTINPVVDNRVVNNDEYESMPAYCTPEVVNIPEVGPPMPIILPSSWAHPRLPKEPLPLLEQAWWVDALNSIDNVNYRKPNLDEEQREALASAVLVGIQDIEDIMDLYTWLDIDFEPLLHKRDAIRDAVWLLDGPSSLTASEFELDVRLQDWFRSCGFACCTMLMPDTENADLHQRKRRGSNRRWWYMV